MGRPRSTKLCDVPACGGPHKSRGYCTRHYRQFQRHGSVGHDRPVVPEGPCSVSGCGSTAKYSSGLCQRHQHRLVRHGNPEAGGPDRNNPKHRYLDKRGYAYVKSWGHPNGYANGYMLEHIKEMSELLGRPLLPGENVHHKNGKRDDNRPENLELWVTMQPSGQRPEDLVAFAREILSRYESMVT